MRLAVAIVVVAVALSAAVYLHERTVLRPVCGVGATDPHCYVRPSWEDPIAVLIGLGGLALAAGILTARRGR